jgi:hypothetical protein
MGCIEIIFIYFNFLRMACYESRNIQKAINGYKFSCDQRSFMLFIDYNGVPSIKISRNYVWNVTM